MANLFPARLWRRERRKMDLNLEAYKRKTAILSVWNTQRLSINRDSMELLSRCFCAVVEELIKGQEKTLLRASGGIFP